MGNFFKGESSGGGEYGAFYVLLIIIIMLNRYIHLKQQLNLFDMVDFLDIRICDLLLRVTTP